GDPEQGRRDVTVVGIHPRIENMCGGQLLPGIVSLLQRVVQKYCQEDDDHSQGADEPSRTGETLPLILAVQVGHSLRGDIEQRGDQLEDLIAYGAVAAAEDAAITTKSDDLCLRGGAELRRHHRGPVLRGGGEDDVVPLRKRTKILDLAHDPATPLGLVEDVQRPDQDEIAT